MRVPLRDAVDAFLMRQLAIYRTDPTRLQRDAASAHEVVSDHLLRWPYELIQNADDAGAKSVYVHVTSSYIYFADDGVGLTPSAVESLSGTHYSAKPPGAIGRKGLGFKAVYSVTTAPEVFSREGGIRFDHASAKAWLNRNNLVTKYVPYHWLPEWLDRREAENADKVMHQLSGFATVVRLPLQGDTLDKAIALLDDITGESLVTFRNITSLIVRHEGGGYEIRRVRNGDGTEQIADTRAETTTWRLLRRELQVPEMIVASAFDDEENRKRSACAEVLVGAPLSPEGQCVPTKPTSKLLVYYATQRTAPARLLVHASFLVKSDRSEILPISESGYNEWLAKELARTVVAFVRDAYSSENPSSNLRLLQSCESTDEIRSLVLMEAAQLRLPNALGEPVLAPAVAKWIENPIADDVRTILDGSLVADALIHASADRDRAVHGVLKDLSVKPVLISDVVAAIVNKPAKHDEHWLKSVWRWLSVKFDSGDIPIDDLQRLEIIPTSRGMVSAKDCEGLQITSRVATADEEIPDWLPLVFIDDWLVEWEIQERDAIDALLDAFGFMAPNERVELEAVAKAVATNSQHDNPGRYLAFLLQRNWHEFAECPEELTACPVPARPSASKTVTWTPARDVYFGREWGNRRLERLYRKCSSVKWAVLHGDADFERYKRILEWLGVRSSPRVIESKDELKKQHERGRVYSAALEKVGNVSELGAVKAPTELDRIQIGRLGLQEAAILLELLAEHWASFYEALADVWVHYRYYGPKHTRVRAAWWHEVLRELRPATVKPKMLECPLGEYWIPTREVAPFAALLPIIDLKGVRSEKRDATARWLREAAKLRSRLSDLTADEIGSLLKRLQEVAISSPAEIALVRKSYDVLLEVLRDSNHWVSGLDDISLLARKGSEWEFRKPATMWLADALIPPGLAEQVWLFQVKKAVWEAAVEYLQLRRLSEHLRESSSWESELPEDHAVAKRVTALLEELKPLLFVKLRTTAGEVERDELLSKLKQISAKCVRGLVTQYSLNEQGSQKVHRDHVMEEATIIVDQEADEVSAISNGLCTLLGCNNEAHFVELLASRRERELRMEKLKRECGLSDDALKHYLDEWNSIIDEVVLLIDGSEDVQPKPHVRKKKPLKTGNIPTERTPEASATSPRDSSPEAVTLKTNDQEYEVVSVPPAKGPAVSVGNNSVVPGAGGPVLTQTDRLAIEKMSREYVEAVLVGQGYDVDQKPFENEGFDIEATSSSGEKLLVEVKGHLRRASVIDLTAAEHSAYARSRAPGSTKWELWNVENLDSGCVEKVRVTVFKEIPDDAIIGVRSFRIDLTACKTQ